MKHYIIEIGLYSVAKRCPWRQQNVIDYYCKSMKLCVPVRKLLTLKFKAFESNSIIYYYRKIHVFRICECLLPHTTHMYSFHTQNSINVSNNTFIIKVFRKTYEESILMTSNKSLAFEQRNVIQKILQMDC